MHYEILLSVIKPYFRKCGNTSHFKCTKIIEKQMPDEVHVAHSYPFLFYFFLLNMIYFEVKKRTNT